MGAHMKTTIDIADPLFLEAKRLAEREGTTLKALVETGLREVLAGQQRRARPFTLRRTTFKGKGLRRELEGAHWQQMRELAYEGRGA
jgi:hypothetical protein